MRLTISRGLLDEMRRRAEASPDAEICGLLLGQGDAIQEARACNNVSAAPADSFEIDPAALIAAHRAARGGGLRLLGHYHSHPRGPARPSARDLAAAEPGSYWIILGEGGPGCWRAVGGVTAMVRFEPVELIATD